MRLFKGLLGFPVSAEIGKMYGCITTGSLSPALRSRGDSIEKDFQPKINVMTKENNRNKWLHIRLTDREMINLKQDLKGTTHQNLSEYTRRILLGKVIIGKYKDTRTQEFLKELVGIRRILQGLATNYNQIAKKMNSTTENEMGFESFQVQKLEESIQIALDQLNQSINRTTEKWFQL